MNPQSKTAQYIFYLVVFFVVIGLMVLSWYLYSKTPAPSIESNTSIFRYTLPIETRIIRTNLPGKIDTVLVDNTSYEIARYRELIDKGKVKIDFGVEYNERTNLFNIDTQVTALVDSVVIEKEVVKTVVKKPPFLGLTGGLSVGASYDKEIKLSNVGIDAGFKVAGKYSLTAFGTTDKIFGLRFGVDF